MKLRKNKEGFTLIELLLVMAIIGILAGMVFVAIGPARKRARITAFKESMNNFTKAATMCIDGNNDITDPLAFGAPFCDGSENVPTIKTCQGGPTAITAPAVDPNDNDDFVITADCTVATGLSCHASCSENGCIFGDNDAQDNGCPNTSAPPAE